MKVVFTQQMSKVKQLAQSISQAISMGEYAPGAPLPSINHLSRRYQVSRDTVFKAFGELKGQGIVDSTPTKGYFVSNGIYKVLLLLDMYSPFKSQLHDALTRNLPMNYKVDLYFHQQNEQLFNKIVRQSVGQYNMYLIMNYRNDVYSEILNLLDPAKVLLLDFG
ncbi:MAG: winged helix-turn-helix domain-containing protein, partial [Mediterranea sp.]|nr:winged helix-turn-helix domain-containing protein [Mediterranea sp.]